ncbi:MAG: hypothetical protein ACKO5K_00505 [Armatimonadota bacterium]
MLRRLAALSPAILAVSAAHAQEPVRPAVFIGNGRPLSSVSRTFAGDSVSIVGLRVPFGAATAQLAPDWGRVTLDIDWQRVSSAGSAFSAFGAYLTERIPIGRVPEGADGRRRPWFGLGLGLGQVGSTLKIKIPNSNPVRYETISQTKLRMGGKVVVGKYLSDNIFVEGGYFLPGTQLGVGANSLALGIGVKF